MYGLLPQQLWHQCASGGSRWLAVQTIHEALCHTVALSYPCPTCGQRVAQPTCSTGHATAAVPITRTPPPSWLPIVKAVVSAECPACGLAINISDTIANNPEASERERIAAEEFSNGVAVVGGIALLFIGLSWLASRPRLV